MHPKISINTLCLPEAPLDTHEEQVTVLGAHAIGPGLEEVMSFGPAAAGRLLRDTGLAVATLTHRAFAFATEADVEAGRQRLDTTIDVAAAIGAATITMTTGGRGELSWSDAAARFAEAIAPCADRARASGIVLSLEPTSHLYADASIAHRLTDTVQLARMAGIGVGIDLFACWFDADIEQAIRNAGPLAALVQVSDHIAGDRGLPCRAVPGDGMVPVERLVGEIARTGYDGFWDIEVIGPRIVAEGWRSGLTRAAERLGRWINES